MNFSNIICRLLLLGVLLSTNSCEKLVAIDTPTDKLISEEVFRSEETAISAMNGIYNQLYQASFSNGSRSSITVLSGLSSDNVQLLNTNNLNLLEFDEHEVTPENIENQEIWNSAHNIIYLCNSFIEGISSTATVDESVALQLESEARFVRAFTYFYLVNLYKQVPLVLTTNYQENELQNQADPKDIYNQIISDLEFAITHLETAYRDGERIYANKSVSEALLARVYLFLEEWTLAEEYSNKVIEEAGTYELLPNLEDVFLKNSREAIWQISPIGGGGIASNTNDGNMFIIDPVFSFLATFKLNEELVGIFDEQDLRFQNWIGYNEGKNAWFAHKYKIQFSSEFPIQEYSMVLRLAEQYLIRAESRLRIGKTEEALSDINSIRTRAGLDMLSQETDVDLLQEILTQRRKELFTEWGHRWLDLKRTGNLEEFFSSEITWELTDKFYPIPAEELIKNPNLLQNEGY